VTKTIWQAKQKIAFIDSLRKQIATLTDDAEAIRDTLDGELEAGEFEGVISCLLHARAEELAVVEGRASYIEALEAANRAAKARAEKIKEMIGAAMRAASQDSYKGALGTVSFGRGRDQVIIEDEARLPAQYIRPVVDKALVNKDAIEIEKQRRAILADALMSASERDDKLAMLDRLLPGVRVVPGDDILTIRAPAGKK
jgi:hypothetical protein